MKLETAIAIYGLGICVGYVSEMSKNTDVGRDKVIEDSKQYSIALARYMECGDIEPLKKYVNEKDPDADVDHLNLLVDHLNLLFEGIVSEIKNEG